jgi:hypothetical protein
VWKNLKIIYSWLCYNVSQEGEMKRFLWLGLIYVFMPVKAKAG